MCNAKLVREMIDKHKPEPLRCLVNSNCWCSKLDRKLIHSDDVTDCMSPEEMLKSKSQCFSEHDLVYLKSLLSREFINFD